jgi:hypothetical protein
MALMPLPLLPRLTKRIAIVDALLNAGANINERTRWWAGGFEVLDSTSPELANYLISRGARVDIQTPPLWAHKSATRADVALSNFLGAWCGTVRAGRTHVSIEEVTILVGQVRLSCRDIKRDTQTRSVPNVDKAIFHDGVRQPIDNLIPPVRLA